MKAAALDQHINELREHLKRENPILLDVVTSFRELDKIAYRLGLLADTDSFTRKVSWWPMIAVLGTFSSGKSTFINSFLGQSLQQTGSQAVDDKFTVICHSEQPTPQLLPGSALDADPRFPFFQISRELDLAKDGEGARIESYLQLKTCASERLKGKVIIDSPGFDADQQRNATLRITDHIIDLSDLVVVFFDARHPEPGAMRDTLEHLVGKTISRPDAAKFVYVLNQIDNAARENNTEEVFGAWQRALSQQGLLSGRFYTLYDPHAAISIADQALATRFESKRLESLSAIEQRFAHVEIERSYRICSLLQQTTKQLTETSIPTLIKARASWRRRTMVIDAVVLMCLCVAALYFALSWGGLAPPGPGVATAIMLITVIVVHVMARKLAGQTVLRDLARSSEAAGIDRNTLQHAFRKNLRAWRSIFAVNPVGMGFRTRRQLERVASDADGYVKRLNDRFARPSDERRDAPGEALEAREPSGEPSDNTRRVAEHTTHTL